MGYNFVMIETYYLEHQAIVDIYYQKSKRDELKYFKGFVQEYVKLIDFFNVSPPKITIRLLYSRPELDEKWGSKTETWVQAMVDNTDPHIIYIFSPLVFEQLTKHKKEEMLPTIVHEAAHTFVSEINTRCFYWVNEGICQFVEGEHISDERIHNESWAWFKDNNALIDPQLAWDEQTDHQGYLISYAIVKYIIESYGKDAIISLLKIKRVPDEELKNKMGMAVNNDFDELLEGFEKTLNLV